VTVNLPLGIKLVFEVLGIVESSSIGWRTSARAVLLILGIAASAHAIPVTYTFSGHLIGGDLRKLHSISLNDAFRSSITIESRTPDSESDSRWGRYSPNSTLAISIGSNEWLVTLGRPGLPEIGGFDIFNGIPPGNQDVWSIYGRGLSGPSLNGFGLEQMGYVFTDSTAAAFRSDAIPIEPFASDAFDQRTGWMFFRYAGGGIEPAEILIQMDSIEVVLSEPGISLTFCMGIAALIFLGRRPKASHRLINIKKSAKLLG
jgi:hypothetical protein